MHREDMARLIESHQGALYRYVRYLGAERPLAEDICQETFLAVIKGAALPEAQGPNLERAYLRGVARNLFLSHCRRQRRSPVRVDSDGLAQAEAIWQAEFLRRGDGSDYLDALRLCLQSLPEDQGRLVRMQYAQRMSRAAMAQQAGMTEDGIKSAMRRIRARLAACIAGRLGLPVEAGE